MSKINHTHAAALAIARALQRHGSHTNDTIPCNEQLFQSFGSKAVLKNNRVEPPFEGLFSFLLLFWWLKNKLLHFH